MKLLNQVHKSVFNLLYKRKVSRHLSHEVRNNFRIYFEGERDYNWDGETSWFIPPQIQGTKISNLGITALNVFRIKGTLTLQIVTSRPGICIGRRGELVDAYKEFISLMVEERVAIDIIDGKSLFKY